MENEEAAATYDSLKEGSVSKEERKKEGKRVNVYSGEGCVIDMYVCMYVMINKG